MNERSTILVTGATGNVGGQVVRQLSGTGVAVRALTRNPEAAELPESVEVVGGDLSDPDTLDTALDGVDAVFLVFPSLAADHVAPAIIDKIAEHARHIVYLSAMGVPDDPEQAEGISGSHARVERLIARSGSEWTFVRAGGFAANTLMWVEEIRAGGVVRWPYGEAARSLIHEADIAAVAVRALTEQGHAAAKYAVTGPETLTQAEQVRIIGEATDRTVRWEELSREAAHEQLVAVWGDPVAVNGALDYWAGLVQEPEGVTSTVEDVTGTPARTFREWAIDHAGDFR